MKEFSSLFGFWLDRFRPDLAGFDRPLTTQRQSKRGKAILKCLNEGRPLADVPRKYKVCSTTIQNDKRKLATDLMAFMGPDIIHEASRPPRWHDNLHATKLKLASKEERERL